MVTAISIGKSSGMAAPTFLTSLFETAEAGDCESRSTCRFACISRSLSLKLLDIPGGADSILIREVVVSVTLRVKGRDNSRPWLPYRTDESVALAGDVSVEDVSKVFLDVLIRSDLGGVRFDWEPRFPSVVEIIDWLLVGRDQAG